MNEQHSGDSAPQGCPVERCINAAQPPEKWASCFYGGSPCQTERPQHIGSSERPEVER